MEVPEKEEFNFDFQANDLKLELNPLEILPVWSKCYSQ